MLIFPKKYIFFNNFILKSPEILTDLSQKGEKQSTLAPTQQGECTMGLGVPTWLMARFDFGQITVIL